MTDNKTGFRRASDTRESPEVPTITETSAEKRAKWAQLSKLKNSYGPRIGQLGLPLTPTQASQLLDASGFPSNLSKYKPNFIQQIVYQSSLITPRERRSFENLLEKAKHTCSKESMSDTYIKLKTRLESINPSDFIDEQDLKAFIEGTYSAPARFLAYGYDIMDAAHFIFDENGDILDINVTNKERKPKCLETIRAENLRKEGTRQFNKFLKDSSDPYKGSLQGLGRTHKRRYKCKKTLRRTKMRRNMH
jgi:hypothetical protein